MSEGITLHELLTILPRETKVGIWDTRKPYKPGRTLHGYEKHPNRQSYCKIENLNYAKIMRLLDKPVYCIRPKGEDMLFIQIM